MDRNPQSDFIQRATLLHGDFYDYSAVQYIDKHILICIICPQHGPFYQSPAEHLYGHSCALCDNPKGKAAILAFLIRNNINYKQKFLEDYFPNLPPVTFDFYLPSFYTYIDYNGPKYFQPLELFGGNDEFIARWHRNAVKDKIDMYGSVLRISYANIDKLDYYMRQYIDLVNDQNHHAALYSTAFEGYLGRGYKFII